MNRLKQNHSESGFTMAAFIVVLTIGLIFMAIAAPSVLKESQREREEEMLWRGHQIAIALSKHAGLRNGQMPTDLKDLVDGITVGVKKTRLLRPHALCDPMVPCEPGEVNWKTVHAGDPLIKDLLNAYIAMQQNNPLLPPPSSMLVANAQGAGVRLPGQNNEGAESDSGGTGVSGGSSFSLGGSNFDTTMTPILGVVSKKSEARMFRSYYGIEDYNRALFFAGVPVYAGGVSFGVIAFPGMSGPPSGVQSGPPPDQGGAGSTPSPTPTTTYQRCGEKGEGVMINGVCYGASGKKT